jgi:hypothetical protein
VPDISFSWGEVPLVVTVRPSGVFSLTSRVAIREISKQLNKQPVYGQHTCRSMVEVLVDELQ